MLVDGTRSVDDEKGTKGNHSWRHKDEKLGTGESIVQVSEERCKDHSAKETMWSVKEHGVDKVCARKQNCLLHNGWKRRHLQPTCIFSGRFVSLQSSKEIGLAVEKLDAKSNIIKKNVVLEGSERMRKRENQARRELEERRGPLLRRQRVALKRRRW